MRPLATILLTVAMAGSALAQNLPYKPTDLSKLKGLRTPSLGLICGPSEGGISCGTNYICVPLGASCCVSKGGKVVYCPNGYTCRPDGRCLR
jgi:hypothetical protein